MDNTEMDVDRNGATAALPDSARNIDDGDDNAYSGNERVEAMEGADTEHGLEEGKSEEGEDSGDEDEEEEDEDESGAGTSELPEEGAGGPTSGSDNSRKDEDESDDENDGKTGEDNASFIAERRPARGTRSRTASKERLKVQSAALKTRKAADSMKRYAYLLGQTDIFGELTMSDLGFADHCITSVAHFINLKKMKGEDVSAFRAATSDASKTSKGSSNRHRKTEKEEDEELLNRSSEDDDPPFQFEESPSSEDRAHRIGQTKQVVVFRFVTENAVEEKVIDRASQKLRLDQLVIQQGRTSNTKTAGQGKEELLSMIQHGAQSIFESTDSNDFQFFPPELVELVEKETFAKLKHQGYRAQKRAPAGPEEDEETLERERQEEQAKIDAARRSSAEPLTESEQAEKVALLQNSFESWARKDFNAFIRANEKHGRDNLTEICKEVEGKSPEEVARYAEVFWARYKELQAVFFWREANEKHIAQIEKGEQRLQNQLRVQECLRNKVAAHRQPLHQLRFNYGTGKGKNFTEEEDRFL
ncbi:hypothetical protein HK405_014588, partial [Cladochytrium tenue]